jgi:hypothetical protein
MTPRFLPCIALLLIACGDDARPLDAGLDASMNDAGSDAGNDSDDASDAGDAGDAGNDAGNDAGSCRSIPPADHERFVVVSAPFGDDPNLFTVHRLSVEGELSATGISFALSRAFDGQIAFSLDGALGAVAQDDGGLGLFRVMEDGNVNVITSAPRMTYVSNVVADPNDMNRFWMLNSQTRNNGGGIYALDVDCDGNITDERLAIRANLPYKLRFDSEGPIVLARDVGGDEFGAGASEEGLDVHRIDLESGDVLESADLFSADEWIGGGFDVDDTHAFGGDIAGFSGTADLVAVAATGPLMPQQEISAVEDPLGILVSPFGDRVIAVSGFGNDVFVFNYDDGAVEPLSNRQTLAYITDRTALPGIPVRVQEGSLSGLVLIPENQHIRRVQFTTGSVTDLGRYSLGEGSGAIPGALGVQP